MTKGQWLQEYQTSYNNPLTAVRNVIYSRSTQRTFFGTLFNMTQFGMKQMHLLKSGEILFLKEATLFFVCQPEKTKK